MSSFLRPRFSSLFHRKATGLDQAKPTPPITVGGQAVPNGVMMRAVGEFGATTSVAWRGDGNDIAVESGVTTSLTRAYPFLGRPFLRGVIVLVESIKIGFQAIRTATAYRERQSARYRQWDTRILVVVAVLASVGLFLWLPVFAAHAIVGAQHSELRSVVEGLVRVGVFLAYVVLAGLPRSSRTLFAYHAAEHKVVNCYEKGLELTPANAMAQSRIHPRCGTAFFLWISVVGAFVFALVGQSAFPELLASRVLLLPVVAAVTYELVRFAARPNQKLLRVLMSPGLGLQLLTTRRCTAEHCEVAIKALKGALAEVEAAVLSPEPVRYLTAAEALRALLREHARAARANSRRYKLVGASTTVLVLSFLGSAVLAQHYLPQSFYHETTRPVAYLIFLPIVVAAYAYSLLRRSEHWTLILGSSLTLAGVLANGIWMLSGGYVVDYLAIPLGFKTIMPDPPDIAVVVGIGFLISAAEIVGSTRTFFLSRQTRVHASRRLSLSRKVLPGALISSGVVAVLLALLSVSPSVAESPHTPSVTIDVASPLIVIPTHAPVHPYDTTSVSGTVNTEGYTTHYYFQWGFTPDQGSPTPVRTISGNAKTVETVEAELPHLDTDRTYYVRLVAWNKLKTVTANASESKSIKLVIPGR